MRGPLFVYGNWSAYDELSDGVVLDEGLAMRQMGELDRLRAAGVRFDAYLMDAFWFARDGGYRQWRTPHWPDGPDRWLDACAERGLIPGLWFTANTAFEMDPPAEWRDSLDAKGWGYCCFEGGFLPGFINVLEEWYDRGIRLFKLDFADFGACPRSDFSASDIRALNVGAYREALASFRAPRPDAIFMGFNGFEDREYMDRSDRAPGAYVSPEWLSVLDTVYSGDPRPSDLPCPSFWRSVDVYGDCVTRVLESSGFPLSRIDNCGFMAGETGTCYWRGKAGWQGQLLLSLARGGGIHVAYGDLGLFTDDDARWWARAQELYASGGSTSFGGWPGAGEAYGWRSGDGILTVVNPGIERASLTLPEGVWKVIGADPDASASLFDGTVSLCGGQLAVLGRPGVEDLQWGERAGLVDVSDSDLLADVSAESNRVTVGVGGEFLILVSQTGSDGGALRTYPNEGGWVPFSAVVRSSSGGVVLEPMTRAKIWSGLSWASFRGSLADGDGEVQVASSDAAGRVRVRVYRARPRAG